MIKNTSRQQLVRCWRSVKRRLVVAKLLLSERSMIAESKEDIASFEPRRGLHMKSALSSAS